MRMFGKCGLIYLHTGGSVLRKSETPKNGIVHRTEINVPVFKPSRGNPDCGIPVKTALEVLTCLLQYAGSLGECQIAYFGFLNWGIRLVEKTLVPAHHQCGSGTEGDARKQAKKK